MTNWYVNCCLATYKIWFTPWHWSVFCIDGAPPYIEFGKVYTMPAAINLVKDNNQ